MAKPLVFLFGDQEIPLNLNKVDRSKLYGFKEVEAVTEDANLAELHAEQKRGTIFTFPYSYRGGLEADTAFLLNNVPITSLIKWFGPSGSSKSAALI